MKVTKARILRIIEQGNGEPVHFRDMARHFAVTKGELHRFEQLIESLAENGDIIALKGRRYAVSKASKNIIGRLTGHREGYGFVTPDEGGEDIFIPARYMRGNLHGDKVEVLVVGRGRGGKSEGRIAATISRGKKTFVGKFERKGAVCRVVPDEMRIARDIFIPSKFAGEAKSGQVVVVEILSYPKMGRSVEGRVIEVLGWPEDSSVEALATIRKHDLPDEFSSEAIEEANALSETISPQDLAGRTDLRKRVTFTIDGENARDFDDAVSIHPERGGKVRLWVSIADVSHYVKPGSCLDKDAFHRGTSVYFPDRCLPMLPERLSNGICSLKPGVDRLTMTVELLFDRSGGLLERAFYPSVIRSSARLTYSTVKELLLDISEQAATSYADLSKDLVAMEKLAHRLMERRRSRGSIDFDLPEPEIVMDLQGETIDIVRAERNIAHRIIEEFMLAANEAVASFIAEHEVPSVYRVHEMPDPVKLREFSEFIHGFGYTLNLVEDAICPSAFQRILGQAEGKPEERMINQVLLRCMKQARYSVENLGHFGLAALCYTHFTSPIRRYPDLEVHRILKKLLSAKTAKLKTELNEDNLREMAAHSSARERRAMEAERDIVELKKLQFMADKVGNEYEGFITGVISQGFFVELVDLFVEGMVQVTTLPHDYYRYVEKQHAFFGERRKSVYRIGDPVRVLVASVSIEKRQIDFVLPKRIDGDNHPEETANYTEYSDGKRQRQRRQKKGKKFFTGGSRDSKGNR